MPVTVLYPEARQQPDELERGIFGADVRIVKRDTGAFSELSDADCAEADGLMIMGFGVIGLGRIGTAVALRAKAFNFRVVFYDPYLPNGAELALGISRAATLEDLLRQTNTLSIHAPLTPETRNLLGREQFALMPKGAVVVNDARGAIIDVDALYDALRDEHIAAAGLDVLPVEPPVEPIPKLLRAYRAKEPWLEGPLVIPPPSA